MGKIRVSDASTPIAGGEDFQTHGALWGERGSFVSLGRLPRAWVQDAYQDEWSVDYVVYSYATPIAWHVPASETTVDHWVFPSVKYSRTTSNHQSAVRSALWHVPKDRVRTEPLPVTV